MKMDKMWIKLDQVQVAGKYGFEIWNICSKNLVNSDFLVAKPVWNPKAAKAKYVWSALLPTI